MLQLIIHYFSIAALVLLLAVPNAIAPVTSTIEGKWLVPRFTPPARHSAVLKCFPQFGDTSFGVSSSSSQQTSSSDTQVLQLLGGILQTGASEQNSYTFFDSLEEWSVQKNPLPAPVSSFALAYDDVSGAGRAYMFGGSSQQGATPTDANIYERVYDSPWRRVLLRARSKDDAPALTRMGSWLGTMNVGSTDDVALFVWGGLSSAGLSASIYAFRVAQDKLDWCKIFTVSSDAAVIAGIEPEARYDVCCEAVSDDLSVHGTRSRAICFGGAGLERDFNDMWQFDFSGSTCSAGGGGGSGAWTRLHAGNTTADPQAPTVRRGASCAWVRNEGVFVVWGGYDANSGLAVDDTNLYRFDINSKTWNKTVQRSEHVSPRYDASMAACYDAGKNESTLFLFGGNANRGELKAELFEIHLGQNTLPFPAHSSAGNLQLEEIESGIETRPAGRAEHVAVLSGGDLVILFGRTGLDYSDAAGDVWRYSVEHANWTAITLSVDETTITEDLVARSGASAMEYRSSILVFGGINQYSQHTNDLLLLQPLTGELRKIVPSTDTAPPVRAYHIMVRLSGQIVIGTGWNLVDDVLGDFWRFDSINQRWIQLVLAGDTQLLGVRLGMVALDSFNTTHSIIGLGIGARVYSDWFFVELSADLSTITCTQMSSLSIETRNITTGGERSIIRAYTGAGGSGNRVVVCGGAIGEADPPPPGVTECFQVDFVAGKIDAFPRPYFLSVYGTTTMVRDKLLYFGGMKISATAFSSVALDIVQVFNITNLCPSESLNDDACVKCSVGSKNTGGNSGGDAVSCVLAPQGKYIKDGLTNFQMCKPGQYSQAVGSFSDDACLPCPAASYNPQPGQATCQPCPVGSVCPAGASEAVSATTEHGVHLLQTMTQSGKIFESNPPSYRGVDIPWMPILTIGVTALVLIAAVAIVLVISRWVWKKRRDYYVPEDTQQILTILYQQHARSWRGLNEQDFITATFSDDFPMHEGSLLEMQQLFKELNVNGVGALSYRDFIEAFVLLISRGHMEPLPGSEAAENDGSPFEHWAAPLIGKWDVRTLDKFSDDHITAAVGEKILSQQLSYGGAISLVFYVSIVILVLAIVINFLYNNTSEQKASVPRAVIQSSFGTSLFQVTSDITASVTVLGPVRSMNNIDTLRGLCLADDSSSLTTTTTTTATTTSGKCRTATSVVTTNIIHEQQNIASISALRLEQESITSLTCSYDNETGCSVTWTCRDCYVPEGAVGTLFFRMAPQVAASTIDVLLQTSTGIRDPTMELTGKLSMTGGPDQPSRVITRAVPMDSSNVLTGSPATSVFFGLTPTYYEADDIERAIDSSAPTYKATGYHLRQAANTVPGNMVPTELFAQYFDAPVQIFLTTDEVPLLVRRKFTQTVVQLIVSLLGAIAGLSGGLRALVQFLDQHTGVNEHATILKYEELEKNESEAKALEEMYKEVESLMSMEEYRVLRPLVDRNVPPHKAQAFLEVLRRKRQSQRDAIAKRREAQQVQQAQKSLEDVPERFVEASTVEAAALLRRQRRGGGGGGTATTTAVATASTTELGGEAEREAITNARDAERFRDSALTIANDDLSAMLG